MKLNDFSLLIMLVILIIITSIICEKTNACGDNECYSHYIQYEMSEHGELCYSKYYYNDKFYKLYMPCTRQAFLEVKIDFNNNEIDKNNYFYKLMILNNLLIKNSLEPLYY